MTGRPNRETPPLPKPAHRTSIVSGYNVEMVSIQGNDCGEVLRAAADWVDANEPGTVLAVLNLGKELKGGAIIEVQVFFERGP